MLDMWLARRLWVAAVITSECSLNFTSSFTLQQLELFHNAPCPSVIFALHWGRPTHLHDYLKSRDPYNSFPNSPHNLNNNHVRKAIRCYEEDLPGEECRSRWRERQILRRQVHVL